MTGKDVGDIKSIKLGHKDDSKEGGWKVECVIVTVPGMNTQFESVRTNAAVGARSTSFLRGTAWKFECGFWVSAEEELVSHLALHDDRATQGGGSSVGRGCGCM